MLISVCIPYYNGFNSIERCVDSIFRQNNNDSYQVEVFICADSWTERCKLVLQSLGDKYPVYISVNKDRLGLQGNWNETLKKGQGDIRTLMHQDDYYGEHCFASVVDAFIRGTETSMVSVGSCYFNRQEREIYKERPLVGTFSAEEYLSQLATLLEIPSPPTMFFNGQALQNQGTFYSDKYLYCPEAELYANVAQGNRHMNVVHCSEPLIYRNASRDKHGMEYVCDRFPDLIHFLCHLEGMGFMTRDVAYTASDLVMPVREVFQKLDTLDPKDFDPAVDKVRRCTDGNSFALFAKKLPGLARATTELVQGVFQNRMKSIPYAAVLRSIDKKASSLNRKIFSNIYSSLLPEHVEGQSSRAPIVISGFHHSGTRLVAQLLSECGLFQPVTSPTHEWKYIQLLNILEEREYLNPEAVKRYRPGNVIREDRDTLLRILASVFRWNGEPWGFKEPRTTFTIGAWLAAFPEARIVHVVRDPMDVVLTLPRAYGDLGQRNASPQEDALFWARLWKAYEDKFHESTKDFENILVIPFEKLCQTPGAHMQSIADGFGLSQWIDPESIQTAIDKKKPGIWKQWLRDEKITMAACNDVESYTAGYRSLYGYA